MIGKKEETKENSKFESEFKINNIDNFSDD